MASMIRNGVDSDGQLAQELVAQSGDALAGERSAALAPEKADHVEDQTDYQDMIADCFQAVAGPANLRCCTLARSCLQESSSRICGT